MRTPFSLWFEYDMSFSRVCGFMVWSLGVATIWGGCGNVGSQDWRKHVTGLKPTLVPSLLVSACCLKKCLEATLTSSPTPLCSAQAQAIKHLGRNHLNLRAN